METKLCLADISTGVESGLTVFDSQHMFIGREPESGVCVLDEGISRRHGRFVRLGTSHWFYQDLGSTNGSYVNGVQLEPQVWFLVREGDIVQLADICLRLREILVNSGQPLSWQQRLTRSRGILLVMQGDRLLGQLNTSEQGVLLQLGGPQLHSSLKKFPLEGANKLKPALVLERSGSEIIAYGSDPALRPMLAGQPITQETALADRAVLMLAEYTIIYEADLAELANEPAESMDWIAQSTKRTAPVQLVEVQAQRTSSSQSLGKDLVPVGYYTSQQAKVAPAQMVTTTALALIAGSSTVTNMRREADVRNRGLHSHSRNLAPIDQAILMQTVGREIVDTFAVISGVLALFVSFVAIGCIVILLNGYSLSDLFSW